MPKLYTRLKYTLVLVYIELWHSFDISYLVYRSTELSLLPAVKLCCCGLCFWSVCVCELSQWFKHDGSIMKIILLLINSRVCWWRCSVCWSAIWVHSLVHLQLHLDVWNHQRSLYAEPSRTPCLRLSSVTHSQQDYRRQSLLSSFTLCCL